MQNARYYALHRSREIARVTRRQRDTVCLLRELRQVPCADCKGVFSPTQMDFDHRDPAEKMFRVTSSRAMLMPRKRLLAEVAKCDVVCANCHRIRTQQAHVGALSTRRGTGSSLYLHRKREVWQRQAQLLNRLRGVPCQDCGGTFPPCAMDFDHREPRTKSIGVTRMIGRAGAARILAEATKCDIVCANCHRHRTAGRRVHLVSRE